MKKYRWKCPTCETGRLLGPRPKKNATALYCLPCSSKKGTLVMMICPALEIRRTRGRERSVVKTKRKKTRVDAIYMVGEFDIRKMHKRVWKIAHKIEPYISLRPPRLVIKYGSDYARTLGTAHYGYRGTVMIKRGPKKNTRSVEKITAILIHEIAHFIADARGGGTHDDYFRGAMIELEDACKQAKLPFFPSSHEMKYIGMSPCTEKNE